MRLCQLKPSRHRAFTLIELSVVLAIVGLLAGGIIAGQSIRKGQELRTVGTDATTYMTAIHQFKQKYGYFPGDFPTATQVWGTVGGGTAQCAFPANTASVGDTTCNGDGDNVISLNNNANESFRAWQHMVSAKMIAGVYTGAFIMPTGAPWPFQVVGTNIPKSSVKDAGFFISSYGIAEAVSNYYDGNYDNSLTFGKAGLFGFILSPAIFAADAAELDGKFDDGLPAVGSVRSFKPAISPNCAVDGTTATAYKVGHDGVACALVFMPTFGVKK